MVDDLIEEVLSEEETTPHDYPFLVGKYDLRMLGRVKERMPSWKELSKRREPEFQEFDKFLDSAFLSLWKPSNLKVSPLTKSASRMEQVLTIASSMPEWKTLRNKVQNHYVQSALATMIIGEHIVFPEDPPGEEGQKEGGSSQDNQGDGEGEQDTDDDGGAKDPSNDEAVRKAIAQALQEANEAADNADSLAQLWGDGEGDEITKDPEQLYSLVKSLRDSERLKLISRMLGRLRNQLHHSQMVKSQYIPEEFVDVTLGNDLANLMPNSRLLLADEELEVLFILKYLQRSLMQQKKEGREPLTQGPVIMLVDVSGSMDMTLAEVPGVGNITRVDWAAAVALTLTLLAKMQNREYYIALFDTHIKRELRSADGPITAQTLVDMLAIQGSGGTNFEVPLKKGLDVLKQSAYDKADIVFVTDGECAVSKAFLDGFNETKEDRGFRVLGLACASINPRSLTGFCDRVLSVNSLMDADKASHEIFSIGDK